MKSTQREEICGLQNITKKMQIKSKMRRTHEGSTHKSNLSKKLKLFDERRAFSHGICG